MKVDTKLSLILGPLVLGPLTVSLFLAYHSRVEQLELFLCLLLIAFAVGLKPLANYLGNVIFMADIREMNRFCLRVKQGDYDAEWPLPPEGEDEHELMQLKRNFYWMVHAIASREDWLRCRLNDTAQSMEKFEQLSFLDGLTRISNRRFFEIRVREMSARALERGEVFHLMMLDCDGFKAVNDTLGHLAGDDLLVRLAEILRLSTREEKDTPFRYGGDEFGVLVSGVTRKGAVDLAERIRRRFADLGIPGTSLSVGLAEGPGPRLADAEHAAEEIKRVADEALYAAKRQGKDRVVAAWNDAAPEPGPAPAHAPEAAPPDPAPRAGAPGGPGRAPGEG